jgi:hypothetical protein
MLTKEILLKNAAANNTTTISTGTMGQSTVYTLGDIGASTGSTISANASFVVTTRARTFNYIITQ